MLRDVWQGWVLGVMALSSLGACIPNPGGANRGARSAGSGHGGVEVGQRELAVSPDGLRAVYSVEQRVRVLDLGAMTSTEVPAPGAALVAFRPKSHGFFVQSRDRLVDPRADNPTREHEILAFDGERPAPLWRVSVPHVGGGITPLASGAVVLWGSEGIELLDSANGARSWSVDALGVPVDLDEVGGSVLVTEAPREGDKVNPRRTVLRLLDVGSGRVKCQVAVENCTDEVVATADGRRAFLAPTFCGRDPVSVIDLEKCAVERTLPGFGPVALAAGGRWAVAFADRDADDGRLLPLAVKNSEERFHLLRIDPQTLAYEPIALGGWLPRYATTARATLLVDTARKPAVQVRLVDLERGTVATTAGPAVPLEAYALAPDGQRAFVLSSGLYVLRFDLPQLDSVPLKFLPVALNLTPDGRLLLLRDDEDRVHVLDAATLAERAVVAPQ